MKHARLCFKLVLIISWIELSQSCANWTIVNPPIIFGETAVLGCIAEKDNETTLRSWHGGPYNLPLTINDISSIPTKYKEVATKHPFTSMLEIYQFSERDVDCNYICTIGLKETNQRLSLNEKEFEYHPKSTAVVTNFHGGTLKAHVQIPKVYPKPKCKAYFQGNDISKHMMYNIMKSGKMYQADLKLDYETNHCTASLEVYCLVGKTNIPVINKHFHDCQEPRPIAVSSMTEQKSTTWDDYHFAATILATLVSLIMCTGLYAMWKYHLLKKALCCDNLWRSEDSQPIVPPAVQKVLLNNHQEQGSIPEERSPNSERSRLVNVPHSVTANVTIQV